MPIENIKQRVILQNSTDIISQNHAEVMFHLIDKVNELIDFLNTREQDRSEQMGRVITRFERIEKEIVLYHRALISLKHKVEEMDNDLFGDENGIKRPKEEECNLAPNCCYHGKCICGDCTTEEESIILGCPFCGMKGYLHDFSGSYNVNCQNNSCFTVITHEYKTKQEAILAWNKRHE